MSLVFAAVTPHPPILLPTIGKQEVRKVAATTASLNHLEEELYLSKPSCIIIISPHGELLRDAFTINYCTTYQSDFRQFGDLTTHASYKGDLAMANAIREASKSNHIHASLVSEPVLDHGTSVPLSFLMPHLADVPIVPIGFSGENAKAHFEFGRILKDVISKTNRRVAVIASGDLSHALSSDAPAGFNKAGAEFDEKIQQLLVNHNSAGIMNLDPAFVESAAECGLRSILILLGILEHINYSATLHSYEAPFGVGYLTASFGIV